MASTIKVDTIQSTTANVSILNSAGTEYARFDSTGVFQLANPTTFPAGTALLPSITATGDTNTGLYFPAADTIAFTEGGVESMRIDSSGNVGIGTSSPSTFPAKFAVSGSVASGGQNYSAGFSDAVNSTFRIGHQSGLANLITDAALGFYTASTERMRIDSSGYVGINFTPTASSGQLAIKYDSSARACLRLETSNASTAGELINFIKSTGSATGAISFGASQNTIVYGGTSDYRLKENIASMIGALSVVSQLKPCTYTWKSDGSAGQGFIAHELQSVLPDAVVGEKDAVETYTDEDNKEQTRPKYQQIDTSFLVATLTAAIQEQQALIIQLQADVAALKAK